jgi:hypothetical protein
MNEQDLRAFVREVVARRLASHAGGAPAASPSCRVAPGAHEHPSHALYVTVVNADEACVIEPGARCDHCGYCKSHGH